jgi:ABC-type microcin C transport system permease subunit YejB
MNLDPAHAKELQSLSVVVRFIMRIAMLAVLSAFAGGNFGYVMLLVSVLICAIYGLAKGEQPLGDVLTYWDEAAVYGALFCLASIVQVAGAA